MSSRTHLRARIIDVLEPRVLLSSATLQQGAPPFGGQTSYDFHVIYTGDASVDAGSIDDNDITVTGPNGLPVAATRVTGLVGNGSPLNITYRVAAPGGRFDASDAGTYTIALNDGEVKDVTGAPIAGGALGIFNLLVSGSIVGQLDPTFGDGSGVSRVDPAGPSLIVTDFIALADGSAVGVGYTVASLGSADAVVFKVTPSGAIDTSFGDGGTGVGSVDVFGGDDRARAIQELPDGKFLVAGTTSTYDGGGNETDADFFLARFNANGTLDHPFGVVNSGFGVADFGGAKRDHARDFVILPDGHVMVFGDSDVAHDDGGDFAMARFTATGTYDTSFGFGGRVTTNLGGADIINSVVLDPGGEIIAAGSTSTNATDGSFAIVRYQTDGSIDTSFGQTGNGVVNVDFLNGFDESRSLVVQPDGKLVAGGIAGSGDPNEAAFTADFALTRFDTTGALDADFGTAGKALVDFGAGKVALLNKLVLQPDGKLVAGGEVFDSLADVGATQPSVGVARLKTDGSLDATFSDDGTVAVDLNSVPIPNIVGATPAEQKLQTLLQDSQGLVAFAKGNTIEAVETVGPLIEVGRFIADVGAPTASVVSLPDISEIEVAAETFTVRYTDDIAVDASTIGTGDVVVTGPNGYSQPAEFLGFVGNDSGGNAPELVAKYQVKPPAATFEKGDEGQYSLSLQPDAVADVGGNATPATPIADATFTVTIPENLPNLRVDSALLGKFLASVVGGSKAPTAAVKLTNAGQTDAAGLVGVGIFASSDATLDADSDTQVASIDNVKIALKPGKGKTLKLKLGTYPSTLADGNFFLIARIDNGGAIPELKESDNNAATAAAITIAAPFFDLSGTPGAAPRGSLTPGGKVSASVLVHNAGNVALKQAVNVQVLASPGDAAPGNGDVNVASPVAKLNLKPGGSKNAKLSFVLPANLAPGTYTLLAKLDSLNVVFEKDETNNLVAVGQFTV
jgi:uncharacterized delta-60 repeat protein